MSIHNRYAHVPLTGDDFSVFDSHFDEIKEVMSVLPEINALILRHVAKLGPASDTFTRDALVLAAQNEELLPRGLDVEALQAEVKKRDELRKRYIEVRLLARHMEQVLQLMGSDVFSGALAAYKAMKTNNRSLSLSAQIKELGKFFSRSKKKDEGPETSDQGLKGSPSAAAEAAPVESDALDGTDVTDGADQTDGHVPRGDNFNQRKQAPSSPPSPASRDALPIQHTGLIRSISSPHPPAAPDRSHAFSD